MNRFKTKKKNPKEDVADIRPSLESESSFSLFRRGKKNQEPETKQELDLTSALPSNDDFRTSLLMNGLSARFSMLREQDDPNSKIGKASDDSVLYSNRQSRLTDFGFGSGNGLGDIAEVESLRAPTFLRKDSNASYDSSVMTRSRPMESNVLFGGRQKVYKVAMSKHAGDGLGGRVVYDGDVGASSFQKWRMTEKEKETGPLDQSEDHEEEHAPGDREPADSSFPTRSESPVHGYNKKRETSSTTSSTPSIGRNSTAATSIISQPTTASSTPGLDRQGTRTRKLYEQGLTQNLQEQQNSVFTRVDTLARRPGGGRTTDMSPNTPSPTTQTFNDRWAVFGSERRAISTKGSAPNLRSISPPATGPMNGTMTLDTNIVPATDGKGATFMSPPLSPPISDAGTGEHVNLDIQARDLGKATAMNVFQKPSSPYDDSKYAERMRQLQQGRSTPIQRFRDDANSTSPDSRAQSAASVHKDESNIKTTTISAPKKADTPAQQLDETLESPILNEHVHSPQTPEVRIERPSDQDHPAFRIAITPKPLNFPTASEGQSPKALAMLADSPTLGPTTGGLSGLVRQHLRTESDVSSIYGQSPQASPTGFDTKNWREELDSIESRSHDLERSPQSSELPVPSIPSNKLASPRSPDEEAEFADQLASARRRVREKLTSYVDADNMHSSPPMPAYAAGDLPPPPSRSNPLGILKGKSSRGSLVDRGRDSPRATREPGMSDVTESRLNEEEDAHPSLRAFRQARREVQKRKEHEAGVTSSHQRPNTTSSPMGDQVHWPIDSRREVSRTPHGDGTQHGTFRQPHQMGRAIPEGMSSPPPRSRSRPPRDRSGSENSEGASQQRGMPPPRAQHGQLMPSEMHNGQAPRRPAMRSQGLPGTDIRGSPIIPPVNSRNARRTAAPGTYMAGSNDPANLRSLPSRAMTEPMNSAPFPSAPRNANLEQQRALNQPNIAPRSAPGSGASTPVMPPARRPSIPPNAYATTNGSTLTDAMKRSVNKKDISEPTFVMSTSRVPLTDLPQAARGTRSRSGSIADPGSPPPLPPVNPRRRRDSSKTRTLMGGIMGVRRSEESESAAFTRSTPQLPLANSSVPSSANAPEHDSTSASSAPFDEDPRNARRRLRKVSSELAMDLRASSNPRRISPPQVAVGPPAGRAVVMRGGPSPNMNGGMF